MLTDAVGRPGTASQQGSDLPPHSSQHGSVCWFVCTFCVRFVLVLFGLFVNLFWFVPLFSFVSLFVCFFLFCSVDCFVWLCFFYLVLLVCLVCLVCLFVFSVVFVLFACLCVSWFVCLFVFVLVCLPLMLVYLVMMLVFEERERIRRYLARRASGSAGIRLGGSGSTTGGARSGEAAGGPIRCGPVISPPQGGD